MNTKPKHTMTNVELSNLRKKLLKNIDEINKEMIKRIHENLNNNISNMKNNEMFNIINKSNKRTQQFFINKMIKRIKNEKNATNTNKLVKLKPGKTIIKRGKIYRPNA